MTTYKELLAQRAELEKQIEAARKEALASAIAQVRAIVAEYELTEEDVFSKKAPRAAGSAGAKTVAPKYRDPATGATWTGRGKPPLWIAGQDRLNFLIQDQQAA
ncbi:H-NS histone family protein [Comamonas aquatica]|uniref:H-NS histone family protein n=1 Tax=Comamonas aquatica TaxID=225991 RepID=UPI0024471A44|nr:H-NS histone family protein [Comamonas aquatica]MDH1675310.1 H-NS histone family protein [Comamonas aquatica]MDH1677229.1 H-NS histone family protein [Comamonas aquatica]